jgi:hypothetical protein
VCKRVLNRYIREPFIIVLLLLSAVSVFGRNDKFTTTLGAYTAYNTSKYGDVYEISIRPKVDYCFNPYIELHGGFRVYGVKHYEAPTNYVEFRPWQAVRFQTSKLGFAKLRWFFRLEEKYYVMLSEGEDYFMGRFRAKMDYNVKFKESSGFSFPLAIEMFSPFNDDATGIIPEKYRLEAIINYEFPNKKLNARVRSFHYWTNTDLRYNFKYDVTVWSMEWCYIF